MNDVTYKFKIGQTVELIPSISRFVANGHFQIVSRRPADGEDRQYRIKSRHEPHERADDGTVPSLPLESTKTGTPPVVAAPKIPAINVDV